jgi:hypothetical protein
MNRTTGSIRGFVIGLGVAVGLAALAAPVTIPNVFTAGTPARAADVNANFNAIATAHNETDARVMALDGDLDAHLVAATAANSNTVARITALEATVREPNLRLGGNLFLELSNPSSGNIVKGTQLFIHDYGEHNVFVGKSSGNLTTTAQGNTALGDYTLIGITSGGSNTAIGATSLRANTTGGSNVAVGVSAMRDNTTGYNNTAVGMLAMPAANLGTGNAALGTAALLRMQGGVFNVALGFEAGADLLNGSNNIYIAHRGVANESATLRIGAGQTRAFIAGIRGATTGSSNALPVVIDENGQLGTVVSSRRFKENIADMGDASSLLMRLRHVTFQYREDRNPAGPALQYGLIAEEVASVAPGLVAHARDGQVESVFYEFLPPMMLNELQKQQRALDAQKDRIAELEQKLAVLTQQARRTATLLTRLERSQAAN